VTVRPRLLLIGLIATLALVVAGCGSGSSSGSSASDSAAPIVSANAAAFVAIDTDLGSDQWKKLDALAEKFPGRDKALSKIHDELTEYGVDFEDDVKPALGPEVDVAVVSGANADQPSVALFTKPDDPDKFKQLIAKLNANENTTEEAVYREVDGWFAVSDNQTALDRVLKGTGPSLAGEGSFGDAFAQLPDDALVKAYLNGKEIGAAIREASQTQGAPKVDPSTLGLDKLDFVSASLSAEDDGVRLEGAAKGEGVKTLGAGDFTSTLLGGVPSDALAFLTFRGGDTTDQLKQLESNPAFGRTLGQLQTTLGVSFDELLGLLRNQVGLYVRPGAGIPELTLALETKDESATLRTLDKLAARLAILSGGKVTTEQQAGHTVKTVDLGRFAVHYGAVDGKVLITSGVAGIAEYGGSGEKLPDSADFKEAKSAAGMPDANGGFVYVDLKNAIPLVEVLAGLAGQSPPADVTENLRPLRSILAWSSGSGDSRTFDAFLEIK
jgi:hypothetical protein